MEPMGTIKNNNYSHFLDAICHCCGKRYSNGSHTCCVSDAVKRNRTYRRKDPFKARSDIRPSEAEMLNAGLEMIGYCEVDL